LAAVLLGGCCPRWQLSRWQVPGDYSRHTLTKRLLQKLRTWKMYRFTRKAVLSRTKWHGYFNAFLRL